MPNEQEQPKIVIIGTEEITKFNELIMDTPTKYGYPIIQFLHAVNNKRLQEAAIEEQVRNQLLKEAQETLAPIPVPVPVDKLTTVSENSNTL